jgi:hypothetical protein
MNSSNNTTTTTTTTTVPLTEKIDTPLKDKLNESVMNASGTKIHDGVNDDDDVHKFKEFMGMPDAEKLSTFKEMKCAMTELAKGKSAKIVSDLGFILGDVEESDEKKMLFSCLSGFDTQSEVVRNSMVSQKRKYIQEVTTLKLALEDASKKNADYEIQLSKRQKTAHGMIGYDGFRSVRNEGNDVEIENSISGKTETFKLSAKDGFVNDFMKSLRPDYGMLKKPSSEQQQQLNTSSMIDTITTQTQTVKNSSTVIGDAEKKLMERASNTYEAAELLKNKEALENFFSSLKRNKK